MSSDDVEPVDNDRFEALLKRSSLGTTGAQALRRRTSLTDLGRMYFRLERYEEAAQAWAEAEAAGENTVEAARREETARRRGNDAATDGPDVALPHSTPSSGQHGVAGDVGGRTEQPAPASTPHELGARDVVGSAPAAASAVRSPRTRDGRRTRWEKQRAERRAELVGAALRVLADVGPGFGIEQVAIEAGVTKSLLYRHFADRADLVEAMGERGTEILLDRLIPALNSEEAPVPRIRKTIDSVLGTLEEFPNLYWVLARHTPIEGPDVISMNKEIIATALSALLGDYLRAFGVDSGPAEPWAFALVGAVFDAGEWWLERRMMSRDSITEYLTTLVWAAIDGFARQHGVTLQPDDPLEINKVIKMVPRESATDQRWA